MKQICKTRVAIKRDARRILRIQMRPDDETLICRIEVNSSDVNQWHVSRGVSRGGLPPPYLLFLSTIQRAILQILSAACTSWARVTPSFTAVLLPSVPLLSGGGSGIGGRKVLPLVYITFTAATTSVTTTTADRRHHLHHHHVAVGLVYTQRWGFCRFDKVVSRTQSSTARPRKFGAPIRELQLRSAAPRSRFRIISRFLLFFFSFFFFYLVSQVWTILLLSYSFSCVVLIVANEKMR